MFASVMDLCASVDYLELFFVYPLVCLLAGARPVGVLGCVGRGLVLIETTKKTTLYFL